MYVYVHEQGRKNTTHYLLRGVEGLGCTAFVLSKHLQHLSVSYIQTDRIKKQVKITIYSLHLQERISQQRVLEVA